MINTHCWVCTIGEQWVSACSQLQISVLLRLLSCKDMTWNKLQNTSPEITWEDECAQFPDTVVSFCLDLVLLDTRLVGKKEVAVTFPNSASECNSLNFNSTQSRITNMDRQKSWIWSVLASSGSMVIISHWTECLSTGAVGCPFQTWKPPIRKGSDFFRITGTAALQEDQLPHYSNDRNGFALNKNLEGLCDKIKLFMTDFFYLIIYWLYIAVKVTLCTGISASAWTLGEQLSFISLEISSVTHRTAERNASL